MAEHPPTSPQEATQQRRPVVVRLVRYAYIVLMTVVTLVYWLEPLQNARNDEITFQLNMGAWLMLGGAAALGALVMTIDLSTPNKKIASISGVFFGLLAGMLATFALSFVIDLLVQTYDIQSDKLISAAKVLLGISLCYLGISIVLQTQDDFRLVIPYVEFAEQIRGPKPLLLDSSALIDGRIVDVAATGMLQVPLVIPRFVVQELQLLGDSPEKARRTKGRRGLDMVARLQRTPQLDVTVDERPLPGKNVDQMLVELARIMPALIVTTDSGLARVAAIQGVGSLNLHDVATALKPTLIPGSLLPIQIVKAGEQPGQGVGYLDDGTMVVVERAAHLLQTDVRVEVASSLQTSAGRLIFARLAMGDEPAPGALAPGASDGASNGASDGPAEGGAAGVADAKGGAIARPAGGGDESRGGGGEEAGAAEEAEQGGRAEAGGMVGEPRVVRPPAPPAGGARPGPFPANRPAARNPQRNPRR